MAKCGSKNNVYCFSRYLEIQGKPKKNIELISFLEKNKDFNILLFNHRCLSFNTVLKQLNLTGVWLSCLGWVSFSFIYIYDYYLGIYGLVQVMKKWISNRNASVYKRMLNKHGISWIWLYDIQHNDTKHNNIQHNSK